MSTNVKGVNDGVKEGITNATSKLCTLDVSAQFANSVCVVGLFVFLQHPSFSLLLPVYPLSRYPVSLVET